MSIPLNWRVHAPNLLTEIVQNNPTAWALRLPVQIFANILHEVATRAVALDDPELTALMCRLTLYEEADPSSPAFSPELLNQVLSLKKEPPLSVILFCPRCRHQHVDEGEWATRPHTTHLCGHCENKWDPAPVPTVGVP